MIKVYHCADANFGDYGYGKDAILEVAKDFNSFHHVADVAVNDLEAAYKYTNTIDQDWWTNALVTFHGSERHGMNGSRSTSVGDVVYCQNDNTFWMVAPAGFMAIDVEAMIRRVLVEGYDQQVQRCPHGRLCDGY